MSNYALELQSVHKQYGDFHAVSDLSFALQPGTVTGFLGPNGAGKTTTLRMILDILRPTSGSIQILGASSALKVRHRIGYLPEEKGLYKKMRAWAVIAYFATLKGLTRSRAKVAAFRLLERYGLKDFAMSNTEALSKGMGQKVQLLASIAHDPEMVILDEPFSGLDPVNQGVMEEVINDLRNRGRTVLFCTHVMSHAERLCDQILILGGGHLRFNGTLDEARNLLPTRVIIESDADVSPLTSLPFITRWQATSDNRIEMELDSSTQPRALLEACFKLNVPLRDYQPVVPSLQDVFVTLVGDSAREAVHR